MRSKEEIIKEFEDFNQLLVMEVSELLNEDAKVHYRILRDELRALLDHIEQDKEYGV